MDSDFRIWLENGVTKNAEWNMRYGRNVLVQNAGVGKPYGKLNRYYTVRQP